MWGVRTSAATVTAGIAVAAALVALVGAPVAQAANTLFVATTGADSGTCGASNDPCQTIQQAVNNASSGDTIVVAAGTYNETVDITASLTLQGAQVGNPGSAARSSESPATESVVTGDLSIESSNVTVDGFSFDFGGNQISVSQPGATIVDDVFSGYGNGGGTNDAIGIAGAAGTTVVDNYFTSPNVDYGDHGGAVVQWFAGGCSGSDVSDNVFDDADASALADIYFYCNDDSVSTITVSGNHDTIGGDSSFVNFQHIGSSGAEIDVTNNVVTMTPASGSSGLYFGTSESGVATVDISGNSLTGDPIRAVKLSTNAGLSGPVSITGNDFSDSGVGVYVASGALNGASVTLRGNNLAGETGDSVPDPADGVYNDPSSGGSVDADDNWWGCNAGPGESGCSSVSGTVTSDPWLVLGVSASPSSVSTSRTSTVTADLTHDSDGSDASGSGTILDGTSVGFATDRGNLSASSAGTSAGTASVTLGSPSAGTANVTATFDSQSVSTPVIFTARASGPPPSSGSGTTTTATPQPNALPGAAGSIAATAGGVTFTASWVPGTFSTPVTVTVTPESIPSGTTPAGFAVGDAVVQLTVTSESGASITSFAQPLEIHLSSIGAGDVLGYSSDGVTWTAIPRLRSLPLPAGQPDGYFVNADGSVTIYTRHATLFGELTDTQAPGAVTLHGRITRTALRLSLLGAHDNVAVAGYVVSRNGHGYRAVKQTHLALPLRPGRYTVVALDGAHNASAISNTITVVRTGSKRHPFAIRS